MYKVSNNPIKRSAETLIEVIMAIFVVAVGSAAATSLVIGALQTNSLTRDNLIALNLATESIEAMRSVRDSNWIKFAYNKKDCWNINPGQPECSGAIPAGNYVAYLDTERMIWAGGQSIAQPLDLNNSLIDSSNDEYRMVFKDLSPESDTNGDNIKDNDPDIYVAKDQGTAAAGKSKFYRMIKIQYPTGPTDQEMTVTSLVQWKDRSQVHEVRIVSKLTNYQKVKVK